MRKLILEKIRETLGDKVISKDYVFINRGLEADAEELPVININSINESVDKHDESPRSYRRNLNIAIECLALGNDSFESYEIVEAMVDAIEQLIEENRFLNGPDRTTMLTRIEFDFEAEGTSPLASAVMLYNCERVIEAAEFDESCYSILKQVNIDWKVADNNDDNATDAQDEIKDLHL